MINLDPFLDKVDHVIWDWNGTLLNDIDSVMMALKHILTANGLDPISKEQYLKHFCFPVVDFYKKIGFELSEERFKELSVDFHNYYDDYLHLSEVFTDAEVTLKRVKEMGKRQSVLTAAQQGHIEEKLVKYKLGHYFDDVFGLKDNLAHSKVERGRELMAKADSIPERTLLIGDTDHDLEVGMELGIQVILLEDGHQHPDRLKEKHHLILSRKK